MNIRKVNMKDRFNRLPEFCYVVTPLGEVSMVKLGVAGHWPQPNTTIQSAEEHNEAMDITPEQEEAMLTGSMFGFHVPGADPDTYNGPEISKRLKEKRAARLRGEK